MTKITKEAIEALEAARAHILDAYRIWQADDVSAVPPPKSGAGAAIAKIDAALSSPIAVEGKVKALDTYDAGFIVHPDFPPHYWDGEKMRLLSVGATTI